MGFNMATTYISVIVTNNQGKAQSGIKVATTSQEVRTDDNGCATISTDSTRSIAIFVQGSKAYDGFVSECPNPLVYTI